jgi:hypothetical protein
MGTTPRGAEDVPYLTPLFKAVAVHRAKTTSFLCLNRRSQQARG